MADAYPKVYLYKRIVQAKLYMDRHYSGPLDLEQIADEACFSKFHFIRLFKSIYGLTPHRYLTRVRMEKAKALLQNGEQVTDVCYAVGFESLSSFTALFTRHFRKTPSAWQRQERQRKAEVAAAPLRFIPACFATQKGWNRNFEEAG